MIMLTEPHYIICQVENNNNPAASTNSKPDPDSQEMTLYEGLQIMRKGRFEDQRGTEICFEIPEFLRLPENR